MFRPRLPQTHKFIIIDTGKFFYKKTGLLNNTTFIKEYYYMNCTKWNNNFS